MLNVKDAESSGTCPRCQSARLISGRLSSQRTTGSPQRHASVSLSNTVRLNPLDLTACAHCGLVWTEVGPEELADRLRRTLPNLPLQPTSGRAAGRSG